MHSLIFTSRTMRRSEKEPRPIRHGPASPGADGQSRNWMKRRSLVSCPEVRDLAVNRAIITKGDNTQVVYYGFQQRDRLLTSEFLVKWYLFWDPVYRNRTDGALVRATTPVFREEDVAQADRRLIDLIQSVFPRLEPYFPST